MVRNSLLGFLVSLEAAFNRQDLASFDRFLDLVTQLLRLLLRPSSSDR